MESSNSATTTFPNACGMTRKEIKRLAAYVKAISGSVKQRERRTTRSEHGQ